MWAPLRFGTGSVAQGREQALEAYAVVPHDGARRFARDELACGFRHAGSAVLVGVFDGSDRESIANGAQVWAQLR